VDDEDDSPFVAGLKAWFMGWVSFSRAHLPKSGSFLMSAEAFRHVLNEIKCKSGSARSCSRG
jgi:hypothetical protein